MLSHDWLPSLTSISTRFWVSKDCAQLIAAKIHGSSNPIFFRWCMTVFTLSLTSSLSPFTSKGGWVQNMSIYRILFCIISYVSIIKKCIKFEWILIKLPWLESFSTTVLTSNDLVDFIALRIFCSSNPMFKSCPTTMSICLGTCSPSVIQNIPQWLIYVSNKEINHTNFVTEQVVKHKRSSTFKINGLRHNTDQISC